MSARTDGVAGRCADVRAGVWVGRIPVTPEGVGVASVFIPFDLNRSWKMREVRPFWVVIKINSYICRVAKRSYYGKF